MAGHRILHEIRREMENIVKYRVKLKHAESTFSLQKLFMWSCTKASPNATMHVGQVFAAALCWLLSFTHNPPPLTPYNCSWGSGNPPEWHAIWWSEATEEGKERRNKCWVGNPLLEPFQSRTDLATWFSYHFPGLDMTCSTIFHDSRKGFQTSRRYEVGWGFNDCSLEGKKPDKPTMDCTQFMEDSTLQIYILMFHYPAQFAGMRTNFPI